MRLRLLIGFIVFAVFATALLVIPIGFTISAHENASTLNSLRRDTKSVAALVENDLESGRVTSARHFAKNYTRATGRQILVTSTAGPIIATRPRLASDARMNAVVRRAGAIQISGVIPGTALEGPEYYVAVRLPRSAAADNEPSGPVLVVTYPVATVTRTIHENWRNLGLYGLLMLLAAGGLGFLISTSLTRPVRRVGEAVEAIGAGHLETRAPTDQGPPELRRLAGAINSTSSRLIELLDMQKAFVQDASHQLRTPLTALRLHVENLQHVQTTLTTDDFGPLMTELDRLTRLVESLLAMARSDAQLTHLTSIDIAKVVRDRVEFWQPLADEQQIDLSADTIDSEPVMALEGVLEQVIDNLLSNAFDATDPGGSIRVTTMSTGEYVELHVIDSGIGLSADERLLALRRFWRGRNNKSDGTGLGLAIVEQLIRLSRGSVELLHAQGGGVDARVTLRRAKNSDAINRSTPSDQRSK